jgi:hypothetical protein
LFSGEDGFRQLFHTFPPKIDYYRASTDVVKHFRFRLQEMATKYGVDSAIEEQRLSNVFDATDGAENPRKLRESR